MEFRWGAGPEPDGLVHFYEGLPPELPHPPIRLAYLLVVVEALVKAWEILRERPRTGFDLLAAQENTVTSELREVLCDIVLNCDLVPGFNRKLFVVNREPKFSTFDRGCPDKMPDLCINLIDRPQVRVLSHDGLFIECKPVDADHSVGKHYCGMGMIRFVNGDYAWAMQEAMMVGYVRGDYKISPKLEVALKDRADTIPTDSYPQCCPHSKATQFSEPIHVSIHGRAFTYLETNTAAPPIAIRHLWLRRD